MARAKEFNIEQDAALCLLAKVLEAKRGGVSLSDRNLYKNDLTPGDHRFTGHIDFDVSFTVGEDATAARYYGTPLDAILSLAFYYSGALREHFIRAAMIVREIRSAELDERPIRGIAFSFKRKADNKQGYTTVKTTIPASLIMAEAERIANKLYGEDEEEATITQQQVADCTGKLKVERKYEGPINIVDATMQVHRPLQADVVAA